MKRGIGKANQIGYIVKDLDKALDYWINVMGVGPWFVSKSIVIEDYQYRGKATPLKMSVAVANTGDMQIELILDESEAPTWYQECLNAGKEGINHVSFWQMSDEEYDETYKKMLDSGFVLAQCGSVRGGRFAYFDSKDHSGLVIEISALVGAKGERFKFIADSARDWDGTNPIR